MSKKTYIRQQRHRMKAFLGNKKAVRTHMKKTGRTGSVFSKQTPAQNVSYFSWRPNPTAPDKVLG